jgi:hypothetical protein
MNPFDGMFWFLPFSVASSNLCSDQATHAITRLDIQIRPSMRQGGISHRRHIRLLRLIPHDSLHDRSIYRHAIHGIRVNIESDEPHRTVRPLYTLFCRWTSRWSRSRVHYSAGRNQDVVADKGECDRCRIKKRLRPSAGCENHTCKRWMEGVFPGAEA